MYFENLQGLCFFINFAFAIREHVLFVALRIALWCNGSTPDFGSVCPSSNLGKATIP